MRFCNLLLHAHHQCLFFSYPRARRSLEFLTLPFYVILHFSIIFILATTCYLSYLVFLWLLFLSFVSFSQERSLISFFGTFSAILGK